MTWSQKIFLAELFICILASQDKLKVLVLVFWYIFDGLFLILDSFVVIWQESLRQAFNVTSPTSAIVLRSCKRCDEVFGVARKMKTTVCGDPPNWVTRRSRQFLLHTTSFDRTRNLHHTKLSNRCDGMTSWPEELKHLLMPACKLKPLLSDYNVIALRYMKAKLYHTGP